MPTRSRFTLQPRAIIAIALPLMMLIATPSARAQLPPVIGSPNTATADPVIPRPPSSGDACVVTLFDGLRFTDYASKPIDYRPPLGCEGPWSRIVFEGDFAVSAGRQFDRTANVWLGGVNVYFGTTAEPSRTVSRSWHVERDLTELAPLFMGAQAGEVDLGNTVDATYTGILTGSARVVFYPRAHRGHGEKRASQTAPTPADLVVPMSARPTGGTVALSTSASTLARSIVLPQNVERAYLDVIVQSQASDEFWYTCVPSDVSARLQSCGGTSFREAEITVDGTPAGVAPVFPWIYTGGIDPYLWQPIPGVQSLSFAPYRVDLTPFAGRLSDGRAHEIAVRVHNANDNFASTASVLVYLDHGATRVTGAITENTLDADPTVNVQENVIDGTDPGASTAKISVTASRRYAIAGVARTSHGDVRTKVTQTIDFTNIQDFAISSSIYAQKIAQQTRWTSLTKTDARGHHSEVWKGDEWPLAIDFASTTAPDGSSAQTTALRQEYASGTLVVENGVPRSMRVVSNVVAPKDTLAFDPTGAFLGPHDAASSQRYFAVGDGDCYSRTITAESGVTTSVVDGAGCPSGASSNP